MTEPEWNSNEEIAVCVRDGVLQVKGELAELVRQHPELVTSCNVVEMREILGHITCVSHYIKPEVSNV